MTGNSKRASKIVKAHSSYSGTVMTATFQIVRELGWPYIEQLSEQHVMQVQSSTDTPKKNRARRAHVDGGRHRLQPP
jgi:hypothetical protein